MKFKIAGLVIVCLAALAYVGMESAKTTPDAPAVVQAEPNVIAQDATQSAVAQEATTEAPASDPNNSQQIITEVLNDYAYVCSGWYYEKKCHTQSQDVVDDFEVRVATITNDLNGVLGIAQEQIYAAQTAGKKTAEADASPCSEEIRQTILSSVLRAKKVESLVAAIKQHADRLK